MRRIAAVGARSSHGDGLRARYEQLLVEAQAALCKWGGVLYALEVTVGLDDRGRILARADEMQALVRQLEARADSARAAWRESCDQ